MSAVVRHHIPWTTDEDEDIGTAYAQANGAFLTYKAQTEALNARHHNGKPVRSIAAVRRREGHVVFGKPWGRKPNTEPTSGASPSGVATGSARC